MFRSGLDYFDGYPNCLYLAYRREGGTLETRRVITLLVGLIVLKCNFAYAPLDQRVVHG